MSALHPESLPPRANPAHWHDRLIYPIVTGLFVTALCAGGQRASNSPTPWNGWCSPSSESALVDAQQHLLNGDRTLAYGLAEEVLAIDGECALAHELQAEVHFAAAAEAGLSLQAALQSAEARACFRSAAKATRSEPHSTPRLRALLKVCSVRPMLP